METIYELQNCGYQFIYHWFFLILAGLRHLEKPGVRVKIYLPWFKDQGYHNDSLRYFEDKFEFFTSSSALPNAHLEFFQGETLLSADRIATEGYLYIRNILLKDKPCDVVRGKRIYITRQGSEQIESNKMNIRHGFRHAVLNEEALVELLTEFEFTIVRLELLNLEAKITLFRTTEIILSPFGGGLTFCALCQPSQKIIELVRPNHSLNHYRIICEELGIPYTRFETVDAIDDNSNIVVNLPALRETLNNLL